MSPSRWEKGCQWGSMLLGPPIGFLRHADPCPELTERTGGGGSGIGAGIHRLTRWPTRHNVVNLIGINGLELDQRISHGMQLVEIIPQHLFGTPVITVNDRANFLVDDMGGFIRNILMPGHRPPQKHLAIVFAVGQRPQPIGQDPTWSPYCGRCRWRARCRSGRRW
jgi:hypothetical protein